MPDIPPPPQSTIAWLESTLGASVTRVERLVGGISSAVHRLDIHDHKLDTVVMRRLTNAEWLEREPDVPAREAQLLSMLGQLDVGVATPSLVAADIDASQTDVPTLVMTFVAGKPDIAPADPVAWTEKLAETLVGIHAIEPPSGLRSYRRWDHPDEPCPAWVTNPGLWAEARRRVGGDLPSHDHVFIHRDFHPNNVHWIDGEVTAIVDWLNACTGPIAADLAHCRWNLMMTQASGLAEHFLDHYRTLTGYSEDTTAYDISNLLSAPEDPFPTFAWNELGRDDLTPDVVTSRIETWLADLLDT